MVSLVTSMFRVSLAAGALALLGASGAALADPPGRVARMSYIRGEVGFQPGGSGEWVDAAINRPLVAGDRLSTDRDSRVELEIGAGSIRVDERSAVSLLNIDDRITQIELSDGTLNLTIRRLLEGQTYEVDTPTLAFVVSQPGEYRVDVAPDGDSTMVTVFRGNGDVYGENDASYRVRERLSYRFNDAGLRDYEVLDLPAVDDFDRWCIDRNNRYERAVSSQYVSDEVVGYADLDDYGSWSTVETYGSVWYPRSVAVDWAPYRDGHWAWIDPWGWSWVDAQPWGFAPSHYGRWVQVRNRWGWVPGPRHLRPVYAPALVAFVGGGNWGISIGSNPVGWFPLGPRDVYRPWYTCSQDYFTRVNLRNSRNVTNITIVNVYNDYSRGRPFSGNYTYRRDTRAFTAVPGNVFAGARPVGRDRLRVDANALGRGQVVNNVGIAPNRESLAARGNGRFNAPRAGQFDRRVIARTAPPAAVLPFAQRESLIRNNGNRPLGVEQMRARGGQTGNRDEARVRVVDHNNAARPRELPGAGSRGQPNRSVPAGTGAPPNAAVPGATGATRGPDRPGIGNDRRYPVTTGGNERERGVRDGDGRLRSSRFAPGQREPQGAERANQPRTGSVPNAQSPAPRSTEREGIALPPSAQQRQPPRAPVTETQPVRPQRAPVAEPSREPRAPMQERQRPVNLQPQPRQQEQRPRDAAIQQEARRNALEQQRAQQNQRMQVQQSQRAEQAGRPQVPQQQRPQQVQQQRQQQAPQQRQQAPQPAEQKPQRQNRREHDEKRER